jgi:hypothetical protein
MHINLFIYFTYVKIYYHTIILDYVKMNKIYNFRK